MDRPIFGVAKVGTTSKIGTRLGRKLKFYKGFYLAAKDTWYRVSIATCMLELDFFHYLDRGRIIKLH